MNYIALLLLIYIGSFILLYNFIKNRMGSLDFTNRGFIIKAIVFIPVANTGVLVLVYLFRGLFNIYKNEIL